MCHFYSFRQSAPKPSVGIVSHLCHYATCILHRLGNFIKRILICYFKAGKLHSNFGNERKLKRRETYRLKTNWAKPERLTPKKIMVQKSMHQDSDYSPEQNLKRPLQFLFIHSIHTTQRTPDPKRPFLLHLSENQAHSRNLGPLLASQLSLLTLPKT